MTEYTGKKGDIEWFIESRFGMFIHWGLYALGARHEWVRNYERMTEEEYRKYFEHFNPDLFDPTEWAKMAKRAGMKYFVVTTKHHEGFCLWDSAYTGYKASRAPWGKDLLTPIVRAFRDEGLRVGFYYSLIDWHHPEFPVDRQHPQRDEVAFREATKGRDIKKYAQYVRDQVTELLTGFGQIDIIWFDFSYPGPDGKGHEDWESEKLVELVRSLQPDILINNRLDYPGSADFVTPEQSQPHSAPTDQRGVRMPWEVCHTFSGSWGYHRDETGWKDPEMLVKLLVDAVSKNGNMLLNVGPTGRGEFDPRARTRLEAVGEWMKYHDRAIYGCGAAPESLTPPPDCRYTFHEKTDRLYLHIFSWPFKLVHLAGLVGEVEYAQFLHDSSEIKFRDATTNINILTSQRTPEGHVTLELPAVKPDVVVPVVEIFLK